MPQSSGAHQHQGPSVPAVSTQIVHVVQTKSVGLAAGLGFLLGPLGMLYSTVVGAIVMFFVNLVIGLLTFWLGCFLTWPVCAIWAAVAAKQHNARLAAVVGVPGPTLTR